MTQTTNHIADNTAARSRHDLIHITLCMDMHRSTLVYIYIYIYIYIYMANFFFNVRKL